MAPQRLGKIKSAPINGDYLVDKSDVMDSLGMRDRPASNSEDLGDIVASLNEGFLVFFCLLLGWQSVIQMMAAKSSIVSATLCESFKSVGITLSPPKREILTEAYLNSRFYIVLHGWVISGHKKHNWVIEIKNHLLSTETAVRGINCDFSGESDGVYESKFRCAYRFYQGDATRASCKIQ